MSGRVLIVDDNRETREALATVLGIRGFETVGVADGAQALAYLRSPGAAVWLVLLDLCMPRMDGDTFLQLKTADPGLKKIPVVVYSAAERSGLPPTIPFVRKGSSSPEQLFAAIERVRRTN